jgi:predicted transcriptional regulator
MPHLKGVSHKSDRKILEALLTNRAGLCTSNLIDYTRLDKDTVSRRLKILTQKGLLIRTSLKGKHGHHILYYVPWSKCEHVYYYVYKRPSEWGLNFQNDVATFLSKYFGIKKVSISQDMKIKIELLNDPILWLLVSEEFQKFLNEYEWIKELPSDKEVINTFNTKKADFALTV